MKNTSFGMGLAFSLALGAAGIVAAQAPARHADRPQGVQQDTSVRRGSRHERGGREKVLFRGITLTSSQKASIKALRQERHKQMEATRGSMHRQRGDTTGMAARRAEMQANREKQIVALRSILTPDQRVRFDKNVGELKQR